MRPEHFYSGKRLYRDGRVYLFTDRKEIVPDRLERDWLFYEKLRAYETAVLGEMERKRGSINGREKTSR